MDERGSELLQEYLDNIVKDFFFILSDWIHVQFNVILIETIAEYVF